MTEKDDQVIAKEDDSIEKKEIELTPATPATPTTVAEPVATVVEPVTADSDLLIRFEEMNKRIGIIEAKNAKETAAATAVIEPIASGTSKANEEGVKEILKAVYGDNNQNIKLK